MYISNFSEFQNYKYVRKLWMAFINPNCLFNNGLCRVYFPLLLYLYLDGRQREAEPH